MSAFSKLYILSSLYSFNGDWGSVKKEIMEKGYKLGKKKEKTVIY